VAEITIKQYEGNKRKPTFDSIEKLSACFGVPLDFFASQTETENVVSESERITVPKHIKEKMHRIAKNAKENQVLSREVDEWLEGKGYQCEILRSGNGYSLEELEYGNDITDEFCRAIESGELDEVTIEDKLYSRYG